MKELFRDSFMVIAMIVVVLTPFFPVLLKGICPRCKKRKLENLETVQLEGENSYVTFYRCHACEAQFKRLRSGPFEQTNVTPDPHQCTPEHRHSEPKQPANVR